MGQPLPLNLKLFKMLKKKKEEEAAKAKGAS
jgi:hypothetical protein